ncbi:MAG: hypothetical protein QOH89_3652 [Pseudonocardiales bacterium]|nr:hypothetical protein [Pseudonocardiales bacterium]
MTARAVRPPLALLVRAARARNVRIALAVLTPSVLAGYLLLHHESVEAGAAVVGVADREWIVLGACCAVLTWCAATGCQLGALDAVVPVRRLFATQVASSFVSHVLPGGVGQVGLNARMLLRSGLTGEQVTSAVVLNALAGGVVHTAALLVLLAVAGAPAHLVNGTLLAILIAMLIATCAAAPVLLSRLGRRRTPLGAQARAVLDHGRAALRDPRRATLLVGGSGAILVLHIVTLIAVLHALHQSAPLTAVAVIYLACSAVGAAFPGPGGFGGFDLLLASALISSGIAASYAAGTVIAYRALTVWLPMLPSAVTLLVMVRRKIV